MDRHILGKGDGGLLEAAAGGERVLDANLGVRHPLRVGKHLDDVDSHLILEKIGCLSDVGHNGTVGGKSGGDLDGDGVAGGWTRVGSRSNGLADGTEGKESRSEELHGEKL